MAEPSAGIQKFARSGAFRDTGGMSDVSPTADRVRLCSVCGHAIRHAEVVEAGLCGPCGLRVRLRHLPPKGCACVLCGERRRRALTVWEPSGDPVCHACGFHLREMRPWPVRLDAVARQMRRQRRSASRP